MVSKEMRLQQKLKYPKSVFFIVSNEFCERFSYYGMRTVLVLYLRNKLSYSDDTATVVYHVFSMFVYFFPLLGAMLADSLLGKFRTIFYVSIIYALGQLLLSAAAAPVLGLPLREFSLVGLLLIAIGTGGIKPCVAAFGGDQFILPQQERYLSTFFSLFYFSINSGSFISSFITPLLRNNVSCMKETTCYSLAFFVPAVLMIVSVVIFLIGKPLYRMVEPKGNVVLNVSKCVCRGIYNKIKLRKEKRDHWLDYADDKYDVKLIEDIKAALQVLKLFLPLPVFWALFDQQGSRWTIQATRMNGEIGSYLLLPDQMLVVNPLLILLFIPLFQTCIYPIFSKIRLLDTPLKKLTIGGLLAALSFVISGIVELELEKTYPVMPSEGLSQLRIFNTLNCPVNMTIMGKDFRFEEFTMYAEKYVKANGETFVPYTADFSECTGVQSNSMAYKVKGDTLKVFEKTATSWVITPSGLSYAYIDDISKPKTGNPAVRALIYADPTSEINKNKVNVTLSFMKDGKNEGALNVTVGEFKETKLIEIKPGTYNLELGGKIIQRSVIVKLGAVYSVVGMHSDEYSKARTIMITEPNTLHLLWLIPQYIVITMAEVMFSVTGLEFAFTQAPISMKSLLQAAWLLTVAVGNLIVVIVAEVQFFSSQANEFFLFAGLMFIDIIIFGIMCIFYKYVETPHEDDSIENYDLEEKTGTANESYKHDEK